MSQMIHVAHLGKKFKLGSPRERYKTLRESVTRAIAAPVRRATLLLSGAHGALSSVEEIWALKDVTFQVNAGEVVGIIGRNGAGKSTLLKILSRITEPTEGRVELFGRVASLLEVGTGFHPELSGRDNIQLNGAILGMRGAEIARKFDEIVAFAEVEKFIDTPVKHYSSGMYMRLAFAVAAHLEPEILVVDEVLAVGDTAFQNKCLGKMQQVSKSGRTVLFVSHNMQAVRALCQRCVLLSNGRVAEDGPVNDVIALYNQEMRNAEIGAETAVNNPAFRRGSGAARFNKIAVEDVEGKQRYTFEFGETVRMRLGWQVNEEIKRLNAMVIFRAGIGNEPLTSMRCEVSSTPLLPGASGELHIEFPTLSLRPGEYPLYFWLGDTSSLFYDVVDNLSAPLIVSTSKSIDEIGFDPAQPMGAFSIPFKVLGSEVK